jgi:hypothetical protein
MIESRMIRWAAHVAHREKRHAYKILFGKHERRRVFLKSRHRWENDIKN